MATEEFGLRANETVTSAPLGPQDTTRTLPLENRYITPKPAPGTTSTVCPTPGSNSRNTFFDSTS